MATTQKNTDLENLERDIAYPEIGYTENDIQRLNDGKILPEYKENYGHKKIDMMLLFVCNPELYFSPQCVMKRFPNIANRTVYLYLRKLVEMNYINERIIGGSQNKLYMLNEDVFDDFTVKKINGIKISTH
ncbi:MAG: hypothetical protein GF353_28745 [Candidatus Lokiarchaeota archaeon]|nr:hypothetical protein [Candidatus Lokiarchaeota archaeon]MBD3353991.1 hypothetical protein [Candidatus Lokiarchaeota archaeon]